MVSIIINGKDASFPQIDGMISQCLSTAKNIFVVANIQPHGLDDSHFIQADVNPFKQLMQAAKIGKGQDLLILDARANLSKQDIQQLIESADQDNWQLAFAPIQTKEISLGFPDLSVNALVDSIQDSEYLPNLAFAVKASLLSQMPIIEADSLESLFLKLTFQANSLGISLGELAGITCTSDNLELGRLDYSKKSLLLESIINNYNIEELFPAHDWENFSEESAAAAYHTLAALFIKYNDFENARECLQFSDSLEDSPRSLALRAMISVSKGETLGAVANLVSSLQQYEVRKQNDGHRHYLSFSPTNLEVINENLHQGLDALNKRDNESALQHFATAVFNFDPFYSKNGLDRIS